MTVRTRSIFTVLALLAAACAVERKPAGGSDTSTATPPSTPPSVDAKPSASTSDSPWTVTPDGIGTIRVGMTLDDIRRVAGDVTPPTSTAECNYVKPGGLPAGVAIMLARGQVARIDVDSAGVRSDAGIAVGDTITRVTDAYAGRVTVTPHKYVPGGQYLSVRPTSPADSAYRIVFETENGRVTRFRSGRVPEVEWVERCG